MEPSLRSCSFIQNGLCAGCTTFALISRTRKDFPRRPQTMKKEENPSSLPATDHHRVLDENDNLQLLGQVSVVWAAFTVVVVAYNVICRLG